MAAPFQNIRFCIATGILGGGDYFLPAATPGGPQVKIQYCTKSKAEGEQAYHACALHLTPHGHDEDQLFKEDLAMALRDSTSDSPILFNIDTHEVMARFFKFATNRMSLELSRGM